MLVKTRDLAFFAGLLILPGMGAASALAFEPGESAEAAFSGQELVSEKLQIKLSGKKYGKAGRKSDLAVVAAFYESRKYRPLWVSHGALNEKAQELIDELAKASKYGLAPKDYETAPVPASLAYDEDYDPEDEDEAVSLSGVDAGRLARAEIELSLAALKYIRHAHGGRFDQTRLSRFLDRKAKPINVARHLRALATSDDVAAYLRAQHPSNRQFKALVEALARVGDGPKEIGERIRIPRGPVLKPGVRHAQVALVRRRLGVPARGKGKKAAWLYDEELKKAVIAFQKRVGVKAQGVIGLKTRFAMNAPRQDRRQQILANMERWRWMPRELGKVHIRINIPEYMMRVVRNGEIIHEERVIVGKPTNKTPVFSDEMETVVVNPYWNVPQSIIWNEMNGRIPDGYEGGVRNGRMWIRQLPGPRNALGKVKFLFPNKHAVYMHDTPSKALFNRQRRAFSHGCMRVRNPRRLAEVVFELQGWSKARIARLWASRENQHIALKRHIPVHVTYFTLWADKDGELRSFGDVYGHDNRIYAAITRGVEYARAKFPEVRKQKVEPNLALVSERERERRYRDWWGPSDGNFWGGGYNARSNARTRTVRFKRKRIYRKRSQKTAFEDIFGALF
jgi:murein L,D-transpeptidase YcbB/YkuD